jgi:hypothetical protein
MARSQRLMRGHAVRPKPGQTPLAQVALLRPATILVCKPAERRMPGATGARLIERFDLHHSSGARVDHPQRRAAGRRIVGDLLRIEFGRNLIFDDFAGFWIKAYKAFGHVARRVDVAVSVGG